MTLNPGALYLSNEILDVRWVDAQVDRRDRDGDDVLLARKLVARDDNVLKASEGYQMMTAGLG